MKVLSVRCPSIKEYKILALLISLLGLAIFAVACASTPKGKLILEKEELKDYKYVSSNYFELQGEWTEPQETDNPLSTNVQPQGEVLAVSPDKQHLVLAPSFLFNVESGKSLNLRGSSEISPAFSPDGKRLAFQVAQEIWVRNLETGKTINIYKSRCQEYQLFGKQCETVAEPTWIDSKTLIFAHHVGLPSVYEIGSVEDPRTLNAVSVVDYQGNLILSVNSPVGEGYLAQGETVFGYIPVAGEQYAVAWFDPAELRSGKYNPHPLCAPNSSIKDCSNFSFPLATISQNGSKVLANFFRYEEKSASYWYLLEVRTGKITKLGTPMVLGEYPEQPCLWSPDETSVACIVWTTGKSGENLRALRVIPLSKKAGQLAVMFPGDPSLLRWRLVEWQP